MKKLLLALVLVSVGGVMADALPRGDYQKSCKNCKFDSNNVLTCDCSDGKPHSTIYSSSLIVKPGEARNIINSKGFLSFPLPKGSYQESSSCTYDGSAVLYCNCLGKNGKSYYHNEFRVTPEEDRDIMNIDGILTFSRPNGSYRGNCYSCDYTNGILNCSCKKDDGSLQNTKLAVALEEVRDIRNINGSLTLGALPLGEYIKNCYDCRYKDNELNCRCRNSKGEIKNAGLWLNSGERRNISVNKDGELQFDTSVHL